MLEGRVPADDRDQLIERLNDVCVNLREENQRLSDEVLQARQEARTVQASVTTLRQQLAPLYRALCAVFGELDRVGGGTPEAAVGSREQRVWESWKAKLGGMSAKFIDALLEHGELSVAQLRVAMQCRQQTVYDTASKLGKLGLLSKNGNKYSLKKL